MLQRSLDPNRVPYEERRRIRHAEQPHRNLSDQFGQLPRLEMSEGRLAMALFENAVKHLFFTPIEQASALWWFLHDPRPGRTCGFVWVCDVLGYTPENIRERIIAWARTQAIDWSERRCVEAAGLERAALRDSRPLRSPCSEEGCDAARAKHADYCRVHLDAAVSAARGLQCSEEGCSAVRMRWRARCEHHEHREARRQEAGIAAENNRTMPVPCGCPE